MNNKTDKKNIKRERRHRKIRAKVSGTQDKPRLSVFRSNKYIYAQLINDETGKTLTSFSSNNLKDKKGTMMEKAKETGKNLAELAKVQKISRVVFDRGGFVYTGKIKAVAEGAREGGLQF